MAATLSIVVPCYNEEKVLPLLFDRVRSAAASWDVDYELVCVDDGSSDGTWRLIEEAGAADPRVRGVSLSRNFGQQAAVSAGMHYASGQALVVIDADLQDPPEAIPDLVRSWRSGFKVVHAVRSQRNDRLVKRVLAAGFYKVLAWMAPFRIPRDAGEFVLLDRDVVDIINAMPEQDRYLRGLRAWCGFPQAEVLYKRDARAAGRPQYTFWKSLALAIDGVVSFSTSPLRLATYLGAASLGVAVLGAAAAVAVRVQSGSWRLPGLASDPGPVGVLLVLLVLGLGGAQLACLGIIGEYLGRVSTQVKGRPLWIARTTVGLPEARPAGAVISPPAGRA
jgi:dolichol-phosphate mannosyltransferase